MPTAGVLRCLRPGLRVRPAPVLSKPMMSVEMPKGRTPPLCVYRCWMPETYSAMYSTEGASSNVSR